MKTRTENLNSEGATEMREIIFKRQQMEKVGVERIFLKQYAIGN